MRPCTWRLVVAVTSGGVRLLITGSRAVGFGANEEYAAAAVEVDAKAAATMAGRRAKVCGFVERVSEWLASRGLSSRAGSATDKRARVWGSFSSTVGSCFRVLNLNLFLNKAF